MTIEEMQKQKMERCFTYEQIAAMSGVPLGTVQKILGGLTRSPRYDTVRALESFFMLSDEEISSMRQKTAPEPSGALTGHVADARDLLKGSAGAELIDGMLIESAAPTVTRQRITAELFTQIKSYTDSRDISGMVPLMTPVEMRPEGDGRTLLRPDVAILGDPDRIRRWGILGAPDFVAEVFAPPMSRRNSLKKLAKYADAGVREYWLIDTEVRKLIVYPLERNECLKVYKLEGRVAVGIYEDLFIDLKRVGELIKDYPEE